MQPFDFAAIVKALNSAAIDGTSWESAMEMIAKKTNSFGAVIFPMKGALPYIPATQSMQSAFDVYVRDGWVDRDERYLGKEKMFRNGVVTDADFVTEDHIKRSPYYQEFLAQSNLKSFAAIRVGTGEEIWSLTLHRTFQQEPFSRAELRSFAEISHGLSGIAETATALGFARGHAALSAFDVTAKAALLLNRKGEVVRVNEQAEKLFDGDIHVSAKRLCCSSHAAAREFNSALRRLLWSLDAAAVPPIALPRRGRGPVIAYLMRNFQVTESPLSAFHALAVLVDPEAVNAPSVEALRTAFGLSPGEARLAIALLGGAELQSEALKRKLSKETVRTQLKAIFSKTGVRRQSDLIAMLSRFLPKR